ncbi:TRAP transporter permease [Brachybacterium saurashtrense]|uniref:TRAP transporter permease n=1 Tax=Brachybacterium saurashtrense TaxID=556288 RepID=A0A345YP28_9MICO|nr:TRAP transporter permease [Brachybacterium saurashtrense]AXK45680.1 TRAP transporter permease [Brachybacterium saurashtrense]RRR24697.1 TRAP transporter permease [Brachybacterium saurashtrense]
MSAGDREDAPHASSLEVDKKTQQEAEAHAEELLREHDTASRYRTDLGLWAWVVGGLSVALTLFHLYTGIFGSRPSLIQGAIHLGAASSVIFLLYPAGKRVERRGGRGGIPIWDVALSLLALFANFYIVVRYSHLTSNLVQIMGFETIDYVVATLGIVLTLEATRRCVGLPIVLIAVAAIGYATLIVGQSWQNYAVGTFFTSRAGIFGTPIQVSSTFIFLFLLFAVVLIRTNIGALFNDLAFRLTGRFTGGPAKAAVAASGLQGMISGSSVANTVASGSFTIPLMKRAGFRSHFAGATEATASTGGQLMPPIMGAAAFIMAEYTGVPYSEIILIAVIPAALYFMGAFLSVHFEAKRTRIKGIPRADLPSWKSILTRIDLLAPLVIIVYMMLSGFSPARAALWGVAVAFALSFLRKSTRLSFSGIVKTLEAGARTALPVIAACATAGIVAGTVTGTGLGSRLGNTIIDIAQGNFLLVLLMTMIVCLILGMGLPTTANYVVTATVAAPILVNNFDVPMIAAHMFVFFFGILADVTPPVCLAAYAGSGIAGSNPLKTGVTALRLAIAGFLIPFVFVLEPSLLFEGTIGELIPALTTVVLGMIAISAGLAGYLFGDTTRFERPALVIAGVLMVYPSIVVSVVGMVLAAAVIVVQLIRRGRHRDGSGKDAAPVTA